MVVYHAEMLKRDMQRVALEKGWKGGYTKYLVDNHQCYFIISQGKKNYDRNFHDDHMGSYGYSEESGLRNVCKFMGLDADKYIFAEQSDMPEEKIEVVTIPDGAVSKRRYATYRDKELVTIHAVNFKKAMQTSANLRGENRTYSSYCDGLGIPNGCISQAIEKYRKVMRDAGNRNKGMMYIDRYEALCNFFKIDYNEYAEDYEEVCKRLGRKNEEEQEEEPQKQPSIDHVASANLEGLEMRLESLEKALTEINMTLRQMGNVHMQILEKMPTKKPTANTPRAL